jgi:hypothetical protein
MTPLQLVCFECTGPLRHHGVMYMLCFPGDRFAYAVPPGTKHSIRDVSVFTNDQNNPAVH